MYDRLDPLGPVLTTEMASELLQMPVPRVRQLARQGLIPSRLFGTRTRRFSRDALLAAVAGTPLEHVTFDDAVLTTPQVAALLGLSTKTVTKLAAEGVLSHRRFGQEYRYSRAAVLATLCARPSEPPPLRSSDEIS